MGLFTFPVHPEFPSFQSQLCICLFYVYVISMNCKLEGLAICHGTLIFLISNSVKLQVPILFGWQRVHSVNWGILIIWQGPGAVIY